MTQAEDDTANIILRDALMEERTVWIYVDFTKQVGDHVSRNRFRGNQASGSSQ